MAILRTIPVLADILAKEPPQILGKGKPTHKDLSMFLAKRVPCISALRYYFLHGCLA